MGEQPTATVLKTVSAWIGELGTHSIMDNAEAKKSFLEETGEEPCWGEGLSKKETLDAIESRGKGGNVNGPEGMMFISTLDIAEACAAKYVPQPWYHDKFGMGSAVRACVEAIRQAGH